MRLCVSLKGTLRFTTKRIGLARFTGGNPRKRFGLRMGLFLGKSVSQLIIDLLYLDCIGISGAICGSKLG